MAKSNASEMLTSLDSLFTTQEQRDEAKRDSVQDIPLASPTFMVVYSGLTKHAIF